MENELREWLLQILGTASAISVQESSPKTSRTLDVAACFLLAPVFKLSDAAAAYRFVFVTDMKVASVIGPFVKMPTLSIHSFSSSSGSLDPSCHQ